jgi:hypothetical protein
VKKHTAILALLLGCAVANADAQATQLITGNATPDERARILETIGNISRIAADDLDSKERLRDFCGNEF